MNVKEPPVLRLFRLQISYYYVMTSNTLTRRHPVVKLLEKKFQSGALTGQEKPSTVHSSEQLFASTDINNFRAAFHRTRRRLGFPENLSSKGTSALPFLLYITKSDPF